MLERLQRLAGLARARIALRSCTLGPLVFLGGELEVDARGALRIGARTQLFGGMIASELRALPGAELVIGERCMFNYGVSIVAARSIVFGERCALGAMVRIRDSDGHRTRPVRIGDDVWIAHGAIIEPGVTIGDAAVVAAGAVVFDDVPPGMLAAGNPARCVPLALVDRTVRV